MKKDFHVRLSIRRLNKIRNYAVVKDKTLTQLIEEYIDSLPEVEHLPPIKIGDELSSPV